MTHKEAKYKVETLSKLVPELWRVAAVVRGEFGELREITTGKFLHRPQDYEQILEVEFVRGDTEEDL